MNIAERYNLQKGKEQSKVFIADKTKNQNDPVDRYIENRTKIREQIQEQKEEEKQNWKFNDKVQKEIIKKLPKQIDKKITINL